MNICQHKSTNKKVEAIASFIKSIYHISVYVMVLLFSSSSSAQTYEFIKLAPSASVKLPQDLYYRSDVFSQWWYVTGHLNDNNGNSYGYELTFFAVGISRDNKTSSFAVKNIFISHFALSDIGNKKYYFNDRASRGSFSSAGADDSKLNVWIEQNSMYGTIDNFTIKAVSKDMEISLNLISKKKPVLHGNKGYSNKIYGCGECASLYFSLTNLYTSGTVKLNNKMVNVKGVSWFDREINSNYKQKEIKGWDWFALTLDDGREIMLYRIRRYDNKIDNSSSGTIVNKDGSTININFNKDIFYKEKSFYTSKKTKAKYPSEWNIKIPKYNIDITISPLIEDQEFDARGSTYNYYWEGAAKIEGTHKGKAYVELTGY